MLLTRSFLALALLCSIGEVCADSRVLFDSDPGDYIGAGQYTVFTEGITKNNLYRGISIHVPSGGSSYSLVFTAPQGSELEVGSYGNATRFPFNAARTPGLSVSGDGRGCNTLTGWFRVLETSTDAAGNERLAIDFKQNCEGFPNALYGAVRLNSSLPLAVSGPRALAGRDQVVAEGSMVTLDGSQSFIRSGEVPTYAWRQLTGPSLVALSSATDAKPSFRATGNAALGGTTLQFQLTTTDAAGTSDTDMVDVTVRSKSDPQTYVEFVSDAGDYIGGGQKYHFDTSNTAFTLGGSRESGVSLFLDADDYFNISLRPASGRSLDTGAYTSARRFADASHPGLDVSGSGRGCNAVAGRFDVLQALTDADGNFSRYAGSFEQHCEGGSPALRGVIRYNFLDPRIPTARAGADQTSQGGNMVSLDGSASTAPQGSISRYVWTQLRGRIVKLSDPKSPRPSFTVPAQGTDIVPILFELVVTESNGFKARDEVQVEATRATSLLPFSFAQRSNLATNVLANSEQKLLEGFDGSLPISVGGGQYSINGGPYTASPGSIVAESTLALRLTTASAANTAASATVTVGSFSTGFTATTGSTDTTPEAFGFGSVTGVEPGALVESADALISGINSTVGIMPGPGVAYSLDGGASYTTASGTLGNGASIRVRITAGSPAGATKKGSVKIGGINGIFSVRTR